MRESAGFRSWITPDGSPGPSGSGGFAAQAGRYHLYVSLACPWAHRTLITRRLKGLEALISLSVVHWRMLDDGWTFSEGPGVIPDPVFGARYLYEVYRGATPGFTGRVTVPVLFDKKTRTIVNNESAEIIRIMNCGFGELANRKVDLYPAAHRAQIDQFNARIYETLNNGVYRAGFATTQAAYEEAVLPLFETLDLLERHLAAHRHLCGDELTEADVRLFTTLVRFDAVYFGHFKCNRRRIVDYPNLWAYTRALYQRAGIGGTVNFQHIKGHYYESHRTINPTGIVPVGPDLDFALPAGR